MNPLKKTLLGLMFGFAIGLFVIQADNRVNLHECFLFVLYTIGVIFGWRLILPLIGKVFHLGTDLTFWLLFLLLFRRGFMWGFITLLVVFAFAFGIGCWAGCFICLWECGKYIFGRRDDWKRKTIFPYAEADAYSLILGWFAKYNNTQSELTDDDFTPILNAFPKQMANFEFIADSMQRDDLRDLRAALSIFKKQAADRKTADISFVLLSSIMHLIAQSGKLTYQAREFIILLLDNHTVTWNQFAGGYQEEYGRPLPPVEDVSLPAPGIA